MMLTVTPLQYHSVEVSPEGIGEREYGRRVVFVPASEIQSIAEAYGFVGERPVLQFLFGCALSIPALLYGTWFYLGTRPEYVAQHGRLNVHIQTFTAAVVLMIFAMWVTWSALKRGRYLLVTAKKDRRKLRLVGAVDPAQLADFLTQARSILKL